VIVGLSAEQLLAIHAALRKRFGGRAGVRDLGALEAAGARPFATFGGEDLYPDLASKAAALLHSLVVNHPFVDGNKRVGALASELLLKVNGAELVATDEELEVQVMAVARGERDAESLTIWFRQRVRMPEG
jgi:death on curing protein